MAAEEEVGTNGFSREDRSLLDTMKEGIEMERTTAKFSLISHTVYIHRVHTLSGHAGSCVIACAYN